MNETVVTVVGHVASEPQMRATTSGVKVVGFRLACTERRFDRSLSAWRDGDTMFFTVSCWRSAAENVADSVSKGQPVIVQGRLKARTYDDKDGVRRLVMEIDATAVGHDLTRGVARFTKASPTRRDDPVVPAVAEDTSDAEPVPAEHGLPGSTAA